jgi:hypothetical protein
MKTIQLEPKHLKIVKEILKKYEINEFVCLTFLHFLTSQVNALVSKKFKIFVLYHILGKL